MASSASFSRISSAHMNLKNSRRRASQTALLDAKGFADTSTRVRTMSLLPLEEMVTCPIDFNFLEDPRLLPCGHVFCCQCLDGYLRQLIIQNNDAKNNLDKKEICLPCPICRTQFPIPDNGNAGTFPKAFNHTLILDYIKGLKTQEPTSLRNSKGDFLRISSQPSGLALPSPTSKRKNSILVKSDMLNNLVNDISAIQRCGSNSYLDQAIILGKVQKLMNKIPSCNATSNLTKPDNSMTQLPEPSAPYLPNETNKHSSIVSAVFDYSSIGVSRVPLHNGDNSSKLVHFSEINAPTPLENPVQCINHDNYEICRDVEQVHEEMRRCSSYRSLKKIDGYEIISNLLSNITDVHLISGEKLSTLFRCTISCSGTDDIIHFWRRKIVLQMELPHTKSSSRCEYHKFRLDLSGLGNLKVQYVRFYRKLVYITGILRRDVHSGNDTEISPDLVDPGVVVCCALPETCDSEESEDLNETTSSDFNHCLQDFPIVGRSCLFLRDSVGMSHPDRPTISGLDIDRITGDIYIALCANAMICRLSQNDFKLVEREWFIDGPELSPSYICLAKSRNEVWASCPLNGKVFILDLATDTFHHFTPDVSFGIIPSHIIYTSDDKIFLLDTKLSRVFWFQKVHQTICIQRIDNSLKERKTRGIEIIQPMDDCDIEELMQLNGKSPLCGGIMCADKLGSYVVYPKSVLCSRRHQFCCG